MQVPTLASAILALGAVGAAAIATRDGPAVAQSTPPALVAADTLMTLPILEDRGWFLHAHGGRVRACSVDGASVGEAKTPPKCSDWSE